MPIPHPDKETRQEFLDRCIPMVMHEGTARHGAQATAICSSMWDEANKEGAADMTSHLNIPFEIKAVGEREVEGHGSVFGNVDLGDDIVVPGAFQGSLARHQAAGTMPLMFWMHDPKQVPGVWKTINEDRRGLYVKGELVDTQLGNEVRTLLTKRAVGGLSIGFRLMLSEFRDDGIRLLKEIDLWEVSVVSMAMNPMARVESVKTRLSRDGEWVPTPREFERLMRDAGCCRTVAKMLVAKLYEPDFDSGMLDQNLLRDAAAASESELRAARRLMTALRI